MSKLKLAVLTGGSSIEREVSFRSAENILKNLDTQKYDIYTIELPKDKKDTAWVSQLMALKPDFVLSALHGGRGENGAVQGLLQCLNIPYSGSGILSCALCMNKQAAKSIMEGAHIPVAEGEFIPLGDDINTYRQKLDRLEYPLIVKPVNLGSSVGISVAKSRDEFVQALDDAFMYATRVLIEHAIEDLREINCAVLGDENEAEASECEEPLTSGEILSYEDKYVNGGGGKKGGAKSGSGSKGAGMANLSRKIPAELSPEKREEIRNMAVKAFKALGCNGVSRIDFMIDNASGELYFNEINPIPGSLAFYLWEPVGVPYSELLDRMIQLALKRMRTEEALTFTFDTNILANANLGGGKQGK